MKLVKVVAGLLAAGLVTGAHAVTLLNEGFDNFATLAAAGWVLTNASAPSGASWSQGNSGIFTANAGAVDSYAAVNFNSTSSLTGVVDNWLISPELTLGAGATLTFSTRASDVGFLDLLEVRFSSGSSAAVSGFTSVLSVIGDAANPSYPVGSWVSFAVTLPTATTGRFAFHYSVANALDASYVGVDSVSVNVTAVPEPASLALFALGLGALGVARLRTSAHTSL